VRASLEFGKSALKDVRCNIRYSVPALTPPALLAGSFLALAAALIPFGVDFAFRRAADR